MAFEPYEEGHGENDHGEDRDGFETCPSSIAEESEQAQTTEELQLHEEPSLEQPDDRYADEADKKPRVNAKFKYVITIVITAIVFFTLGQFAMSRGWAGLLNYIPRTYADGSDVPVSELVLRLNEVAGYLDKDAYYSFDIDEATDATITDILASSGDKYAEYLDAEQFNSYMMLTSGKYSGIGVALSDVGKYAMISKVYEGSPAASAGLKTGDVIIGVDGDARDDWTSKEVSAAIKRNEGDAVKLTVLRPTDESYSQFVNALQDESDSSTDTSSASQAELEGETLDFDMTYESFAVTNIDYKMIGDIGYVHLYLFTQDAETQLESAISNLQDSGAKAIILDLRDNGGGYVTQAVGIVSDFVADGAVVNIEYGGKQETSNVSGSTKCDLPMVVLVNENTASASEIVTAALKDHGRATIVGKTTFGKGTMQEIKKLSFGGGIKFTIAEYTSPNGNQVNGVGVTPDVDVDMAEGNILGEVGNDAQLDEALRQLNEQIGE